MVRSSHCPRLIPNSNPPNLVRLCPMARSSPQAASFCPPALPGLAGADATSRRRPWVLVGKKAYIAKRENATTAWAVSSGGDAVEVSFCLADPPALSHLCVHCPGLEGRRKNGGFSSEPVAAAADGAFVLLLLRFNFGPRAFFSDSGIRDYFVYSAGPGKPWLRRLPDPFPRKIQPREVGIITLHGGGGGGGQDGFVVATLIPLLDARDRPGLPFDLHIFSSHAWEWRTVVPRLDASCEHSDKVLSHDTTKVIAIGGGFMGWVDLWRGILLCDVLSDDPVVRLIPLPKPMVSRAWKCCPQLIRDVTSTNNVLSFVEMQFPKRPEDDLKPSYWDMSISDSDSDSDSDATGLSQVSHGWRAATWKRSLFDSKEHWIKDCSVDSAEILCGDPSCFRVLPELWDAKAGRLSLKNLKSSAPVLSMHDDGVVYMMSTLKNSNGQEAWVAAFDVRKGELKALAPFSAKTMLSFDDICRPCSFSNYLGMAAG
ncbi:hypothetical protein ACP70R_025799 [Stipagrostis hirtigluma subsp. patula]